LFWLRMYAKLIIKKLMTHNYWDLKWRDLLTSVVRLGIKNYGL